MRAPWQPLLASALVAAAAVAQAPPMPLPWSATLAPGDAGQGVYIAQNLLDRAGARPGHRLNASGTFDALTAQYVAAFQRAARLNESGVFDAPTADALLACCSDDGYVDDGVPPAALGYLYKIHVRLFANRSIETPARLIAANGSVVFEFIVRAHGVDGPSNSSVWPYFSDCCDGLTQFSDQGGNTPTGLAEADLNTPESNPVPYGPYPVNRMVRGLRGNARWLVTGANDFTTVRDGILMHTGQWSNHSTPPWAPPAPMVRAVRGGRRGWARPVGYDALAHMHPLSIPCAWLRPRYHHPQPNSLGCIHSWPENIARVADILQNQLGVVVRVAAGGSGVVGGCVLTAGVHCTCPYLTVPVPCIVVPLPAGPPQHGRRAAVSVQTAGPAIGGAGPVGRCVGCLCCTHQRHYPTRVGPSHTAGSPLSHILFVHTRVESRTHQIKVGTIGGRDNTARVGFAPVCGRPPFVQRPNPSCCTPIACVHIACRTHTTHSVGVVK
jgi:peptidoglycan hydrolase-like protein with peptidoglycan-binding domain